MAHGGTIGIHCVKRQATKNFGVGVYVKQEKEQSITQLNVFNSCYVLHQQGNYMFRPLEAINNCPCTQLLDLMH